MVLMMIIMNCFLFLYKNVAPTRNRTLFLGAAVTYGYVICDYKPENRRNCICFGATQILLNDLLDNLIKPTSNCYCTK